VISGVLGAASSVTSIQVANLLRLFRIAQVRRKNHVGYGDPAEPDSVSVSPLWNKANPESFRIAI
jgi:hypothetical protein